MKATWQLRQLGSRMRWSGLRSLGLRLPNSTRNSNDNSLVCPFLSGPAPGYNGGG